MLEEGFRPSPPQDVLEVVEDHDQASLGALLPQHQYRIGEVVQMRAIGILAEEALHVGDVLLLAALPEAEEQRILVLAELLEQRGLPGPFVAEEEVRDLLPVGIELLQLVQYLRLQPASYEIRHLNSPSIT